MIPEINISKSLKEMATKGFNLRRIPVRVSSGLLAVAMAGSLGVEAHAVESNNTQETVTMSQLDETTRLNGSGNDLITEKYNVGSDQTDLGNYYTLNVMSPVNTYVNDVPYVDPYGAPLFQINGVTYCPVRMVRYTNNMEVSYSNGVVTIVTDKMTGLTKTNTDITKKDVTKKSTQIVVKEGVKLVVDGKLYTITQKGYNNELAKIYFVGYLTKDANGKEVFVGQTVYIPLRDILHNIGGIPDEQIQPDNGNVYIGTHVKTTTTTPSSTLTYPNLSAELNDKLNKYYNLTIHASQYKEEIKNYIQLSSDVGNYAYDKELELEKIMETNSSTELKAYYNQIIAIDKQVTTIYKRTQSIISSSQLASLKTGYSNLPNSVTEKQLLSSNLYTLIDFCATKLESFDNDLSYLRTNCTSEKMNNYLYQMQTIYNAAMKVIKSSNITSSAVNNEIDDYSYVLKNNYDIVSQ